MITGRRIVLVAIALLLAPAILARHVVGDAYVDGWGTQWFYWFAGEALRGRQSWGHTDLLFFPWGKDVFRHTGGNVLDAVLAWPLRGALGQTFGYDLWVAIVLGTNAIAGARLAAAVGTPAGFRWPAALVMIANPYVLSEIAFGRPTQGWLLFAGLGAAGLLSMKTARDAALAGLWIALAGWTYWFHGLVLGGLAVLLALTRPREIGRFAIAGAVTLALVLPGVLPMWSELRAGRVPGLLAIEGGRLALRTAEGDAEGLWVLDGLRTGSLYDEDGLHFRAGMPAVLIAQAVALGVGVWRLRQWRLALWVAGAWLVASGPLFLPGSWRLDNPVYLWLVTHVDAIRRWWWPARAVFAVQLVSAATLPAAVAGRSWLGGLVLVAGLGELVATDVLPLRSWDATPPAALECLARAPAGAVVDVPWAGDQQNLWFQTLHGHPILGGMLVKKPAFAPAELSALRARNALVRTLDDIGAMRWPPSPRLDPDGRAELVGLGYRYVLARVSAFERPKASGGTRSEWSRAHRAIRATLGEEPQYEDGAFAVWTLDGAPFACP